MYKILHLSLGLLLALQLSNCSNAGSDMSPEEVAEAFLLEMAEVDFDGAKKYASSASRSFLDQMQSMADMAGEEPPQPDAKPEMKNFRSKIDGDQAVVTFEEGNREQDIKLVKEGGAWKVIFTKASVMEEAAEEMGTNPGFDANDEESALDTEEFNDAMNELDSLLENIGEEIETADDK